jgi:hypothetical protein
MKNLVLLLGMFILLGCTSEPPVVETPVVIEEPKKEVKEEPKTELTDDKIAVAVLRASCLSLKATKDVMEADKVSSEQAGILLKKLISVGICGVYYPPRFGILEKLEISYVDSMGIKSQIWKLKDRDLWTIVAFENIQLRDKPQEPINEKTIKHSI